ELGEDRLVVAERLRGRAILVAEPPDEVRYLQSDCRAAVRLVLHRLAHHARSVRERQRGCVMKRRDDCRAVQPSLRVSWTLRAWSPSDCALLEADAPVITKRMSPPGRAARRASTSR